jgi:hypothetical protein
MKKEANIANFQLVYESEDSEILLNKSRNRKEFDEFIAFENDEISIEDVTPVYCPNTIE